jgi:hypothetical protein
VKSRQQLSIKGVGVGTEVGFDRGANYLARASQRNLVADLQT